MEITEIANAIMAKQKEMDKIRKVIKERGGEKARAIADYRKALAVTMVKLLNGIKMDIDQIEVSKITATNVKSIAHGICWQEKLAEQTAISMYDSAKINLSTIETQISALQTIFKSLSKI